MNNNNNNNNKEFELTEITINNNIDIDNNVVGGDDEEVEEHIQSIENSVNEFNKTSNNLEKEYHNYLVDNNIIKHDIESIGDTTCNNGNDNIDENDEKFKLRNYFKQSTVDSLNNGGKLKKMGVCFKNLTVVGKGADQSVVKDLSTPFKFIGSLFSGGGKSKLLTKSTFNILNDVTGFCKDGEMLLVLGRPGSGCSTLLRTISNQISSYVEVRGSVTYGGIQQSEWSRFKGECIYVPEEDTHYPTLTVRETLGFALKCKTPSNRLPNEKKSTFREKIFNLLLNMFGITHKSDTMVGNEHVRGLSGGERKRITITESMISSSSINCYDCSTRGLDAASALDYAKSIRIMSDTLHKTTIATFYQASDSIYNLFDKVLILEKGRCIYFGPVNKAKQYFMDLGFDCEPRKSTPDFLTGVTNPQERIIREEYKDRKVPETSDEFEDAWKQSYLYQTSLQEQMEYEKQIEIDQPSIDFIAEIKNQKNKFVHKKSQYTTGVITQIIALLVRNIQIIWGDKFTLGSRYASVLVQAPIYGSIFFGMTTSIGGAFTRGGAMFSAIFFHSLLSEQEMPVTFTGRRILQKQKSYAMYRPLTLHFAQIITDIPITSIQVFLFAIVVYFMWGLDATAAKFFIHCFTLVGFTLAINNLFRLVGNVTPSIYIGQNIINVLYTIFMTYSAYFIPYNKMHPWLQWTSWVNPFFYTFRALIANEFNGITFDCMEDAIPNGPSYTEDQYRACATVSAIPGHLNFAGEGYVLSSFGFNIELPSTNTFIAYNVCIVYGFWLFFIICNCVALEVLDWTGGGYTAKVYLAGKAPKINDSESERKQNAMVMEATSNMKESLSMPGGLFTWQNINYSVPLSGGNKLLLLNDVEGWIKPGQMTALMGSSGAGKTTLLDVLAKRKTLGTVEGKCYLNGKPLEIDFERITGYVEQMDVLNPSLTVRETLQFSAKLRQEPSVPLEEKLKYVEQVLEMMEMKHLGDALIGNLETGIGISVEERKRTTIGVELVAKPNILFLDEPTSGLDAQSSYNIIKFIRKLTNAGMPLVCTIHQPSSVLFEHFDRILLLAKGGKTVYFGDIGDRSKTLISYFERNGVRPCSESENPAEYILEATGAGVHGSTKVNWPEVWKQSTEYQLVTQELNELESAGPINSQSSNDNQPPREYATSLWYQTCEVYKRLNLIWWRSPDYLYGTLFQFAVAGLVNGWTFYNLKHSTSDLNQRVFFLYNVTMMGIMVMLLCIPQILVQRDFFKRDYASKFYHWIPFAFSMVLVELPYILISGTVFFCSSFFTVGFHRELDLSSSFFFWFIFILFLFYSVAFGQAIAAISPNDVVALNLFPVLIIFLFLFCGVMVQPDDIPHFWKWVYQLNPNTHFMSAMISTVLVNVGIECTPEDLIKFIKPPQFSTCESYAYDFINGTNPSSGYVSTISSELNECGYCIYKNGQEYLNILHWEFDERFRSIGIILGHLIFNIALVISFIYITRKEKR